MTLRFVRLHQSVTECDTQYLCVILSVFALTISLYVVGMYDSAQTMYDGGHATESMYECAKWNDKWQIRNIHVNN